MTGEPTSGFHLRSMVRGDLKRVRAILEATIPDDADEAFVEIKGHREGRLVLADALTEAMADKPDLVLDFATLTGAARSAVGTGIAAMFSPDDGLAEALYRNGVAEDDPVWRMPLWKPYRRIIDSKVADINNAGDSPYAGAITAALFLAEFVDEGVPWAHFDIMAWNVGNRPGRPEGGEAMAMRAAFAAIRERYGQG